MGCVQVSRLASTGVHFGSGDYLLQLDALGGAYETPSSILRYLVCFSSRPHAAPISPTTNTTTGTVVVRLTDAPSDDIQSATIWVSQVALFPGPVILSSAEASFGLLTLQNGVTVELADQEVPTGNYTQPRLIVDSARVVLAPGKTFSDGSTTASLRVPSGSESGLKVNFGGRVSVTSGETVLLIDFDVSRSFVFQGPPGSPNGVSFKPVLHASVMNVAGSISER